MAVTPTCAGHPLPTKLAELVREIEIGIHYGITSVTLCYRAPEHSWHVLARPLKENFAAVSFVAATDFCCAAALLHLAWTGCTATLSHRAWAMEKLLCDVCSRGAHETSWGHYRVDRGSLAPDLSICRDCYDGLAHGFQPEKPPNCREVGPALRADAVARRRVLAWSSKLQKGGAHVASEGCTNFVAESLVTGERVEMIWEDRYDI